MTGPSWLERLWQEWGSARPIPLSRTVEITRQIVATHDVFDVDADAHRFYGDGTESGSTALAAENADHTITVDTNQQVQVRWRVQEIGAGTLAGATTDDYDIEFQINGGGWTVPTGATTGVQVDTGSALTDGGATTQRLANGSGSFFAGEQESGNAEVTDFQHQADNWTEHVYAVLLIAADLNDGDTVDFRMTLNGGNAGMDNTATPTLTIDKTPPPPEADPVWPTFPTREQRIVRPSARAMRSALICEYLHREHSGGELLDSTGNGFRAAMVGTAYNWLQTRIGVGLQTTGRSTRAEIDRILTFNSSTAWEIVFIADETPVGANTPELMGTENNNKVELGNATGGDGSIRVEIMTGGNGAQTGVDFILSGGLYHLIGTRERQSGDNVCYLNGVEVARNNSTQNIDYSTNKFAWGSEGASPSNGLLGTFFLMRIYDTFLDPSEAAWLADDPWRLNRSTQVSVIAVAGDTELSGGALPGSYAITGQAATTLYGRVLSGGALPGSYAITGQPATTTRGYVINAEAGAYAVTGQPATTLYGQVLSGGALPGAYAITGQPATTLHDQLLTDAAVAGSYAVTGAAANTAAGKVLTGGAEPGSYAITGQVAGTLRGYFIDAEAGSYAVTGQAATTLYGRVLAGGALPGSYATTGAPTTHLLGFTSNAEAGSYALTGAAATTLRTYIVNAEAGSYAVTGAAASTLRGYFIDATAGSYATTGAPITTLTGFTSNAEAGSYAVTGQTATTLRGLVINAEAGSYTVTGAAADTARDVPINAAAGSYALTGAAATTTYGRFIEATAGSYTITGAAADTSTTAAVAINAEPGSYAITGQPATTLRGLVINAAAGSYAVTGAATTTLVGVQIDAAAGSYTVTGQAATTVWDHVVDATAGAYVLTGQPTTTTRGLSLEATAGSYAITGLAATIVRAVPHNAEAGAYTISGASATTLHDVTLVATAGTYTSTGAAATTSVGVAISVVFAKNPVVSFSKGTAPSFVTSKGTSPSFVVSKGTNPNWEQSI
jgi:hypothetical protein